MDSIDRQIANLLQENGRISNAEIAEQVGLSVSSASERVRRLVSDGVIMAWRGVVDPAPAGAKLCCFVLIDMDYYGETAACDALARRQEVQELHHISGGHSYLMKLRVADTDALQSFLQEHVKPLPAVKRTESFFSLNVVKETSALKIATPDDE